MKSVSKTPPRKRLTIVIFILYHIHFIQPQCKSQHPSSACAIDKTFQHLVALEAVENILRLRVRQRERRERGIMEAVGNPSRNRQPCGHCAKVELRVRAKGLSCIINVFFCACCCFEH
ncbi:hypothetical protein CI102_10559 [Trichoderma harzianum]|nr:hypothetical protein CI102_10559 [Trichoderma harzianum]